MSCKNFLSGIRCIAAICAGALLSPAPYALAQAPVSYTFTGSCEPGPGPKVRDVSWTQLAPNIACDQRRIWTYPVRWDRRKNLLVITAVAAGTVGLVLLDRSEGAYFRRSQSWSTFNQGFSSTNTAVATVLAPAALYGVGLLRHDRYAQNTALLAGEAAVNAEVVSFVLKDVTHRLRPRDIPANGNYGDTWYDKSGWSGASSFPSGHEIAAFSIATVMARRYGRQHKWVPYVAYGGAALIGLSRMSTSDHFTSDVFLGAVLGYGIGRVTAWQ
jgi:PAP2 superfamily